MIADTNLMLLSGGHYFGDTSWTKSASNLDQCYKVYVPVDGEAVLVFADGERVVRPGSVCFIRGHALRAQRSDSFMEVYWAHFVPESPYFGFLISRMPCFREWPPEEFPEALAAGSRFERLFQSPFSELNRLDENAQLALMLDTQAFLLRVLARLIGENPWRRLARESPDLLRVGPAVDYMNEHYLRNPPLAEIARKAHLTPNYFHRVFKAAFQVTPFEYMHSQRMNLARHLLTGTELSVKEIAGRVGYKNPLYFSKVCRSWFKTTPSELRKREWGA